MAERDYAGPTRVKIKDMNPGDMWGTNRTTPGDRLPASEHPYPLGIPMGGREPGDTVHQRDEPDDTGFYASGGRVRKFGSSTRVTCI